jgi:tetratricopeptide (TPR) repeat protein
MPTPTAHSPRHFRIVCGVLLLVIVCAYWPIIHNDFVRFDDYTYIVENRHVSSGLSLDNLRWAFSTLHSANWHPLTWISHMADCRLFGLRPGGHHVVSLVLHAVNTLLLLLFLRHSTGAFWRSAFVAALFALHPLNIESVAWAAERKNVLSTLFWLLTLLAYVKYVRRPAAVRYGMLVALFALGLMCKAMLVTMPLILLLLDYWPLRRLTEAPMIWPRIREKLPLFALAILVAIVTWFAQHHGGAVVAAQFSPVAERVAHACLSVVAYCHKVAWPVNLSAYYPYHSPTGWYRIGGAALFILTATIGAVYTRRRYPWLLVGWLWFIISLLPVIGLIRIGGQDIADRYMYVPGIGLFIVAAWGLGECGVWRPARFAIIALAGVSVVAAGMLSHVQTYIWKNSYTLFNRAIAVSPDNFFAYNSLGLALFHDGKVRTALAGFTQAVTIEPRFELGWYNKGLSLYYLDRKQEALDALQEAARRGQNNADIDQVMGWIYRDLKRDSAAIVNVRRALLKEPACAECCKDLGGIFLHKGEIDSARFYFKRALTIKPDYQLAWEGLRAVRLRCDSLGAIGPRAQDSK